MDLKVPASHIWAVIAVYCENLPEGPSTLFGQYAKFKTVTIIIPVLEIVPIF
jgi:hypothetical protein